MYYSVLRLETTIIIIAIVQISLLYNSQLYPTGIEHIFSVFPRSLGDHFQIHIS